MAKELQIHTVGDMQTMAQAIAQSGLFGMKTAEQALALMLVAQAEGQHPATITQEYDIIQGRACRKSASLLARFQTMGGTVEWTKNTDTEMTGVFTHPSGGSITVTWNIERAKQAGLTGKDNWKKYPQAMMRARCISEAVRAIYPAAIGGMLVSEEAQDLPFIDVKPDSDERNLPRLERVKRAAQAKTQDRAQSSRSDAQEPSEQASLDGIIVDEETDEILSDYEQLTRDLAECTSAKRLLELEETGRKIWKDLSEPQRNVLADMVEKANEQFSAA